LKHLLFTPDLCRPQISHAKASIVNKESTHVDSYRETTFYQDVDSRCKLVNMSAKEVALRRKFMAQVRRGEKIVGQDALKASALGIGRLQRSCSGEFFLSTTLMGIQTPSRLKSSDMA
jgi:hypothetical protein